LFVFFGNISYAEQAAFAGKQKRESGLTSFVMPYPQQLPPVQKHAFPLAKHGINKIGKSAIPTDVHSQFLVTQTSNQRTESPLEGCILPQGSSHIGNPSTIEVYHRLLCCPRCYILVVKISNCAISC
jgi:hypothetical protein